ncbi:MAG TPA: hypothetical protein VFA07_14965 [Chthonomonadaceae bacterium]|nr:hypothetical protein [Chthonomonadaceae bacterium]
MSEQADLSKPDLRTPFEKFDDLARRAFATPKEEVDAHLAAEKAKRRQAREAKKQAQAK